MSKSRRRWEDEPDLNEPPTVPTQRPGQPVAEQCFSIREQLIRLGLLAPDGGELPPMDAPRDRCDGGRPER